MFTAKLLLVLGSITVLFLREEAAGAVCGQRSPYPAILALPGRPGKNGAPGVPGPNTCPQILPTAASCKEIYNCNPNSPSGYYWRDSTPPQLMYCAMNLTHCGNTTVGWTRVAHINMTSPEGTCPSPLQTIATPRSCSHSGGAGCSSVYISTFGVPFTEVCERAIGYQHHSTDAFVGKNIDDPYVDGLSITYGSSPRHHLWTYAAGDAESGRPSASNCPCAHASGRAPPSFVGDNYYCESGNVGPNEDKWYPGDPLWDGDGCPKGNTCHGLTK